MIVTNRGGSEILLVSEQVSLSEFHGGWQDTGLRNQSRRTADYLRDWINLYVFVLLFWVLLLKP